MTLNHDALFIHLCDPANLILRVLMRSRIVLDVAIDHFELLDVAQSSFKELLIFCTNSAEHCLSVGWLAIGGSHF